MLDKIPPDGKKVLRGSEGHADIIILQEGHVYALDVPGKNLKLEFQTGPVKESGENGWQNEELIRVLIDRLTFLNTVLYSKYNDEAIDALHDALNSLYERTRKRMAAGVEGTSAASPSDQRPESD